MSNRVPVPIIGRAGQILNHGCFIPYNAAFRVLVLVRTAQRVHQLVRGCALIEKPEVHRGLVDWYAGAVRPYITPRTIARVKGYSNLSVRGVVEFEADISRGLYPCGFTLDDLVLGGSAAHKPHLQRAAVDPLLIQD